MSLSFPWTFDRDENLSTGELQGRLQDVLDRLAQQFPVGVENLTRVPQARVYNTAALAITTGTITALTFDSERWDTDTIHDTGANTSRLTCVTPGLYDIGGAVEWAYAAGGARRLAGIRLNGATTLARDEKNPGAGATSLTCHNPSTQYQLVAGDYVELTVFQDSGGNLNINAAGNRSPEFWMHWVSP